MFFLLKFLCSFFFRNSRSNRDQDLRTSSKSKYDSKGSSYKGSKRKKDDDEDNAEFDPMDPSSYSDAPKGNYYVNTRKIDFSIFVNLEQK